MTTPIEDLTDALQEARDEIQRTSSALAKGPYIMDFPSISQHAAAYVELLRKLNHELAGLWRERESWMALGSPSATESDDPIIVRPNGKAYLMVSELSDEDRRYFHRYRALTPAQREQIHEFAAHLAAKAQLHERNHPDCVASMCGKNDCGKVGPCYVSAVEAGTPGTQGCET